MRQFHCGLVLLTHFCCRTHFQFQQFIKENVSEKSRILTQAVEGVKTNINWINQNYQTIVDFLKAQQYANSIPEPGTSIVHRNPVAS